MSAGAKVTVKLNSLQQVKAGRHIDKNGLAQQFLTHEVRSFSDPYVPFDKGPLKNTAVESPTSITYVQPYSRRNYEQNAGRGTQGTARGGLRGSHWVERMLADHGDDIVQSVADFVGGKKG